MNPHHEYLGDAVYASFDGYHIRLHLNSHDSAPLIALEPPVLERLFDYAARIETLCKDEQSALAQEEDDRTLRP